MSQLALGCQPDLKSNLEHSFLISFFLVFGLNHQKTTKINKKVKNCQKKFENGQKVFPPAFSCTQHQKAGQNTQQASHIEKWCKPFWDKWIKGGSKTAVFAGQMGGSERLNSCSHM